MDDTLQWIVLIGGILTVILIIRAFFRRQLAMSAAAQGDLKNIGSEGAREKKMMDRIRGAKNKQQQQAAAQQLEEETKRKIAEEEKLKGDLKKGA